SVFRVCWNQLHVRIGAQQRGEPPIRPGLTQLVDPLRHSEHPVQNTRSRFAYVRNQSNRGVRLERNIAHSVDHEPPIADATAPRQSGNLPPELFAILGAKEGNEWLALEKPSFAPKQSRGVEVGFLNRPVDVSDER